MFEAMIESARLIVRFVRNNNRAYSVMRLRHRMWAGIWWDPWYNASTIFDPARR